MTTDARMLLARSMPESALQASVIGVLRAQGWLVFHAQTAATVLRGRVVHRTAQLGDRGFPDVVAVHAGAGRVLVAELKSQVGRVAPEQRRWLGGFAAGGVESYQWRPSDWINGEVQRIAAPEYGRTGAGGAGSRARRGGVTAKSGTSGGRIEGRTPAPDCGRPGAWPITH